MTKVHQPPRVAGLVERPEVVRQLIDSAPRFALIAAPAGWGKSTLVAEWASSHAESRPFAFVRLGPEDDEPTSFWGYVLASIAQAVGGHPDPASDDTLRTRGIDPTRSLIPNLINRLHDFDEPLVLVLDDFHTMSNPEVHRSVAYLIDNAPRCLHIVIATRSDPPFPLAGYRAAGTMSEVRVEQLAMSSEQTQQFLNQRFDIDLSADDAALVCERTEGWPAGIQLAGLSLAKDPDPSAFVASFAGDDRNIADYLATEVLRRQPAELRQFLLATSILDEFGADVCNYILETSNSAAMLEQIEQSHLFLVRLDSRRTRYRYHHLFRDWLRHEHRLTAEPQGVVQLHKRAAAWTLENGFSEQAVSHLIESADLEGAARLMNTLAASANDEVVRIEQWAADIPDELTAQHTGLALTRVARALAAGDNEATTYWIDTAEKAIGNADAQHQQVLRVSVALWHAVAAYTTGELELAAEQCQAVLAMSGPGTDVNAFYAQGILGASLLATSGPEAALPHLQQGAATRRRLSLHDGGTTAQLAAVHAELGDWERAEEIAAEAFSLPIPEGHPYPYNAPAHFAMAQVHSHRGDSDQAIAHAEKGLTMARNWVGPTFLCWGLFVMSQLVDTRQQLQLLAEAKQHITNSTGQQRLLHRIETAERRLTRPPARTTTAGMILDPLTPRELDVLRLMRGDLSVREIGVELYISHNTAKGYAKTIYQKLGVSSRRDAVATATAADLI